MDWGLLVFFVGLFLIVGGAESAGIVRQLLGLAEHWNLQRLGTFTVVVALLGNIVSNVPAVMLLKSLIPGFSDPHTGWLALAMASTLAGNLTITGSVANLIVVESAKPEMEIGFWGLFPGGFAHHGGNASCRMGVAGVGSLGVDFIGSQEIRFGA